MTALLDLDLVFVTGKGGVGKTTVAAAIAEVAARRGHRVPFCVLDAKGALRPVFANLLLVCLLPAGLAATVSMTREMLPDFAFDKVTVRIVYPGASPEAIYRSITIKV